MKDKGIKEELIKAIEKHRLDHVHLNEARKIVEVMKMNNNK